MKSLVWLTLLGGCAALAWACGPDDKPTRPCNGPSIILVLEAENGPLPEDLLITVRYSGNRDGESYTFSEKASHQAVFCDQVSAADAGSADEQSSAGASNGGVKALRCRLFTQGPARLDATGKGYESIEDLPLTLENDERCGHEIKVPLRRAMDAGSAE